MFAISISTIKGYLKRYRETGSLEPTVQRHEAPLIQDNQRPLIEAMVAGAPSASLQQYCQLWQEQTGITVSFQTMSRVLLRFGLPRKKGQRQPANAMN
jgi:transposase